MKKLFLLLFLLLFCSCGILKKVPQVQIQHDTTVVHHTNTVHEKDSVYFWRDRFIYTKGDTVYNTITEYKYRDRIKEVHDTLYKDKVKIETKTEFVEKELTKTQKRLIALGKGVIVFLILGAIAGIGCIIYKVRKI